jgi:cytochrome b561
MADVVDSARGWGLITRALHWSIALMVLVEAPLGYWLADLADAYGATRADGAALRWAAAHHTLGIAVAILAVVRVNWRIQNVRPERPLGLGTKRWLLARATQASLVGLLFLLPLSGWAAVSTSYEDVPLYFLGWEIPRMYEEPPGTTLVHDVAAGAHELLGTLGAALLAVHVTGVLWSQWLDGSGVLTRMWRGGTAP